MCKTLQLNSIGAKNLKNLQVDNDNGLYWNGEKIKAEATLSRLTRIGLWFSSILGPIGIIVGIFVGFSQLNKEHCFMETISCPKTPTPLVQKTSNTRTETGAVLEPKTINDTP